MDAAADGHFVDLDAQVRRMYACNINLCTFISHHVRRLMRHMVSDHQAYRHLHLQCDLDGCQARPRGCDALRSHVKRYHRDHWSLAMAGVTNTDDVNPDYEMERPEPEPQHEGDINVNVRCSAEDMYCRAVHQLRQKSITLRLFMEHEHEVPAARIQEMHSAFVNYVLEMHDSMSAAVMRRLQELNVADEQLKNLIRGYGNVSDHIYVTPYAANKAFSKLQLVEPKQVELQFPQGRDPADIEVENADEVAVTAGEVGDEFLTEYALPSAGELDVDGNEPGIMHYVSILDTLRVYLSDDAVVDSIYEKKNSADHFSSYASSNHFATHPLFSEDPFALRLVVYIDEFEACNPIGSKRCIYKMTGVYFILENVEQHFLSSLRSVHLIALCRYVHVKKYGYNEFLRPLIADLKTLQTEGICVTTKGGQERTWKGALAALSGDNLTLHDFAGFRRSFSSGKVCRFCLTDYSNFKNVMSEEDCVLRRPETHAMHVQSVTRFPELEAAYGVRCSSPFDELMEGPSLELLAPDILHDILEGFMSFHVTNLIKNLHRNKVVPLKTTIRCTSNFKYGRNDKTSKPRKISTKFNRKNYSVVGSASERWTMFRVLSLALGHVVPEDNQNWKLYLLANEICDIILAPMIESNWLSRLDELVTEHHKLWVELYPHDCKYKWHVLVHYARLIASLGPLRHLWTMRFEAFHQFFIRTARRLKNFINITHTLTTRFQKRRAVQWTEGCLPPIMKILGRQTSLPLRGESGEISNAICDKFGVDIDEEVCWARGVSYTGIKFFRGDIVIIGVVPDGAPIFLKIKELYIVRDKVAILGQLTYVKSWNAHMHAYEVVVLNDVDNFACVTPDQVISPQTLDLYVIDGKSLVKLHFAAPETPTLP